MIVSHFLVLYRGAAPSATCVQRGSAIYVVVRLVEEKTRCGRLREYDRMQTER